MKLRDFLFAIHVLHQQNIRMATQINQGDMAEAKAWLQAALRQSDAADQLHQAAQTPYITLADASYPPRLKEIPSPPLVLFYRGNLQLLDQLNLGVVGARLATTYTKHSLELIFPGLNTVITSGLAAGADTMAHETALIHQLPTIAVLGHGFNTVYPAHNRRLFDRIATDGLLLSEYPAAVLPAPFRFVARNRIIAGLAHGVLVTEAKVKSGSLITANYALQNNREIFALPNRLDQPMGAGTNQLIQAGAKMVLTAADIIAELNFYP